MKMVNKILNYHMRELKKANNLGNLIDLSDVEKMSNKVISDLQRMDLTNIVNRYIYEEVKDKTDGVANMEEEKADYSDFSEFREKYLEEFENFKVGNDDRMQNEYNDAVEFRTNIRGVKLRGNFDTLEEFF